MQRFEGEDIEMHSSGHYPSAPPHEVLKEIQNDKEKASRTSGLWALIPGLADKPDRQAFVVKVYTILLAQMIATVLFVSIAYNHPDFQTFVINNIGLFHVAWAVTFVIMISLVCCKGTARSVPTNYILLGIFTLAESFMVACITSFYDAASVLTAAILALAVFLGLTVYAIRTEEDITMCGSLIWTCMFVSMAALLLFFIMRTSAMFLLLSVVMCVCVSIYVVYDTQIIIGGRKHELELDDYIVAALLLYTDLIMLFIYILRILGSARD